MEGAARRRAPAGKVTLAHTWQVLGIALDWKGSSIPTNHPPFAFDRVHHLLGPEAVFCGLPSGGSCGGAGILSRLPGPRQRGGSAEIAQRPLGLKQLLVYMPSPAERLCGKKLVIELQ